MKKILLVEENGGFWNQLVGTLEEMFTACSADLRCEIIHSYYRTVCSRLQGPELPAVIMAREQNFYIPIFVKELEAVLGDRPHPILFLISHTESRRTLTRACGSQYHGEFVAAPWDFQPLLIHYLSVLNAKTRSLVA